MELRTLIKTPTKYLILIISLFFFPKHVYCAYILTDGNYKKIVQKEPLQTQLQIINTLGWSINNNNFEEMANIYQCQMKYYFSALKSTIDNIINEEDAWYIFTIVPIRNAFEIYFKYYHQQNKDLTDLFTRNINNLFDGIENLVEKRNITILALLAMQKRHGLAVWDEWNDSDKVYLDLPVNSRFNTQERKDIFADYQKKKGGRIHIDSWFCVECEKSCLYIHCDSQKLACSLTDLMEKRVSKSMLRNRVDCKSDALPSTFQRSVVIEEIEEVTNLENASSQKDNTCLKEGSFRIIFNRSEESIKSEKLLWKNVLGNEEIKKIINKIDSNEQEGIDLCDQFFDLFKEKITQETTKEEICKVLLCMKKELLLSVLIECYEKNQETKLNFVSKINALFSLIEDDQEQMLGKVLAFYIIRDCAPCNRSREAQFLFFDTKSQQAFIGSRQEDGIFSLVVRFSDNNYSINSGILPSGSMKIGDKEVLVDIQIQKTNIENIFSISVKQIDVVRVSQIQPINKKEINVFDDSEKLPTNTVSNQYKRPSTIYSLICTCVASVFGLADVCRRYFTLLRRYCYVMAYAYFFRIQKYKRSTSYR